MHMSEESFFTSTQVGQGKGCTTLSAHPPLSWYSHSHHLWYKQQLSLPLQPPSHSPHLWYEQRHFSYPLPPSPTPLTQPSPLVRAAALLSPSPSLPNLPHTALTSGTSSGTSSSTCTVTMSPFSPEVGRASSKVGGASSWIKRSALSSASVPAMGWEQLV